MKYLAPFISLILFQSAYALAVTEAHDAGLTTVAPIVKTTLGTVSGSQTDKVDSFKGIPYAKAPIGEYRWRAPQAITPWKDKGVLDARQFGADCPQAAFPPGSGKLKAGSSEDCLFLNIWRPTDISVDDRLPVMVWIHGGGFVFGSGANPESNGEQFAKQGVILITLNYRLGRLGHFAFPALSAANPSEPKGSYAYMDQIEALRWVQHHIAAFGGDPNNITLFGESAGGVSVHSLLTIPSARGLFHKAIIQSGGGRDGVLTGRPLDTDKSDKYYPLSAETIGVNFAQKHGIEGTDASALAKLRALSVADIVDGGQEFDQQANRTIYSGPIRDGMLVTETAQSAYQAERQAKVPLIIGSNSAEVPAGFVNASTKQELWALFGEMQNAAESVYDPQGNKPLAELLTNINTDKVWAEPARFTARAFAGQNTAVYLYRFGYVPSVMQANLPYGAPHASEIAYVFNNLHTRRGVSDITKTDQTVADTLTRYWTNFAKSGSPNGAKLPPWSTYNQTSQLLEIDRDGSAVLKMDKNSEHLDVIEKAVTAEGFTF